MAEKEIKDLIIGTDNKNAMKRLQRKHIDEAKRNMRKQEVNESQSDRANNESHIRVNEVQVTGHLFKQSASNDEFDQKPEISKPFETRPAHKSIETSDHRSIAIENAHNRIMRQPEQHHNSSNDQTATGLDHYGMEQRALALISSFVAIFTRLATYPYSLKNLDELLELDRQQFATNDLPFRLVRFLCAPLKLFSDYWHQKFDFKFVVNYLNSDICHSDLDILNSLPVVESFFDFNRQQRIQFLLTLTSIQSEINQYFPRLIRDHCLPEYLRLEHYGPSTDRKIFWFVIDYRGNFKLFQEDYEYPDRIQASKPSTELIAANRKELESVISTLKNQLDKYKETLNDMSSCAICKQNAILAGPDKFNMMRDCEFCGYNSHDECITHFLGQTQSKEQETAPELQSPNSDNQQVADTEENEDDSHPDCLLCIHKSIIDDFEILKEWFTDRKSEAAREDALEAKRKKREKIQLERTKSKHENDLKRYKKELEEFEEKKLKLDRKTLSILKKSLDSLFNSIQENSQQISKRLQSPFVSSNLHSKTEQQQYQLDCEPNELDFISESEEDIYNLDVNAYTEDHNRLQDEIEALDELEDNMSTTKNDNSDASCDSERPNDEYSGDESVQVTQDEPCSHIGSASDVTPGSVSDIITNSLIDNFTSSLQINTNNHSILNGRLNGENNENAVVLKKNKDNQKNLAAQRKRGRPKSSKGEKLINSPQQHKDPKQPKSKIGRKPRKELNQSNSATHKFNVGGKGNSQARKIVKNFRYNPLAAYEDKTIDGIEDDEDSSYFSSPIPIFSPGVFNHHINCTFYNNEYLDSPNSILMFKDTFLDHDEIGLKSLPVPDPLNCTEHVRIKNDNEQAIKPTNNPVEKNETKKRSNLNTSTISSSDEPPKKRFALRSIESDSAGDDNENHLVSDDAAAENTQLGNNESSKIVFGKSPTDTSNTTQSQRQQKVLQFVNNDETSEEEISESGIKNIVDSLFETGAAELLIKNYDEMEDRSAVINNDDELEVEKQEGLIEQNKNDFQTSKLELPEIEFVDILQSFV